MSARNRQRNRTHRIASAVRTACGAAACGFVLGGAPGVMAASDTDQQMRTSGDRGTQSVQRGTARDVDRVDAYVTGSPTPRTAGDRGRNQPQSQRTIAIDHDRSRMHGGSVSESMAGRGPNAVSAYGTDLVALQRMLDDAQSDLDRRQAALDEARAGAPKSSGDRGANRVYRPGEADYYTQDPRRASASGDPRTSGDRGAADVFRGTGTERIRRDASASGERYEDLAGRGPNYADEGMSLDEMQSRIDALQAEIDRRQEPALRTAGDRGRNAVARGEDMRLGSDPAQLRTYPQAGSTGDRGTRRVWQEEILAIEQGRLNREQRRIDRLQRRIDAERATIARTTGDRGANRVWDRNRDVERQIRRLFRVLDDDGNDVVTLDEAKTAELVRRQYDEIDADGDGQLTRSEFTGYNGFGS